jgi:hypothetical protein
MIGIHWMTLIVSITLLIMLVVNLVKEKIVERRHERKINKGSK